MVDSMEVYKHQRHLKVLIDAIIIIIFHEDKNNLFRKRISGIEYLILLRAVDELKESRKFWNILIIETFDPLSLPL